MTGLDEREGFVARSGEIVVIGAGQAGLALSYHLTQRGLPHVVFERGRIAESWRSGRWDSFCLVTPNWMMDLPGYPYASDDPDGYMGGAEIAAHFAAYAASFGAPVEEGVAVSSVEAEPGDGFLVETAQGVVRASAVAVATNFLQFPKLPPFAAQIPPDVVQLHTSQYRNPQGLPPGSVLVVGSGQSGMQIAEELHESGRRVYLSVGRTGRVPRRYRGRDVYGWVRVAGVRTRAGETPAGHAHVSGRSGGRDLNLHRFARDGIVLLGRIEGANGWRLRVRPDLHDCVAFADAFEADFKRIVDDYIAEAGIDAPREEQAEEPARWGGLAAPTIEELDLRASGISTVVWGTGYGRDYSWLRGAAIEPGGFLVHERGVTPTPGLYAVGLTWSGRHSSAFPGTVGPEAEHVATHVEAWLANEMGPKIDRGSGASGAQGPHQTAPPLRG